MSTEQILERRATCRARHTGLWAMEPSALRQSVAAVNRGLYRGEGEFAALRRERELIEALERGERLQAAEREELVALQARTKAREIGGEDPKRPVEEEDFAETVAGPIRQRESRRRPFMVDESGIAIIEVAGVMGKGESKFFDVNTVEVRRAVRMAAEAEDVYGILVVFDTPGGTVAGTAELADDIKAAGQKKPLRVHADDLMASAGYWAGVAAERITASRTTEVGSIGTLLVVEDVSKAVEGAGIAVHVISTGAMKGAGVEGTEVTPEQLAMFAERVDDLNSHFQAAVSEGRKLRGDRLAAVSDGRVFIAQKAQALGLIDEVMSFDEALASFRRSLSRRRASRSRASALAAEIDMG